MPSLSEVRFISVISVLRFSLLFAVLSACLSAVPKILNYAGQVSVDGQRFDGEAKLKFALVNPSGSATYWSQDGTSANGSEPTGHVNAQVRGGLYSILIGNTAIPGMGELNASVFQQHDDVHLRVWFSDGVNGFERIVPDRPFAAVPYALSAGSADIAPGSISLNMLESDVQNSLNGTITDGTITMSMLSQEVLNELNSSSGGGGVVPGSLLAVPANQSAPSGYELHQRGEPKELVWEEKAPVSVARFADDGVELIDGKIYFVGGGSNSATNVLERYDPETNSWEILPPMPTARSGMAASVLDGNLYAIGGQDLSSVEIFDPSTQSWSEGTGLPTEVNHATAITFGNKIYLVGGRNASNQDIDQVLCFDSSTNQWEAKANMPTARNGCKLISYEDRIWAIAGWGASANTVVESYDPKTDTWRTEVQLPRARHWPSAWVSHGRIYVGGLMWGSHIDYYDHVHNSWHSSGNLPENKYRADAVVLNDKVYVLAGENASGSFSNKVFAADLNASMEGVYDLYRKDGNASSGVPTVQADVADGSIGPSKLSSEVSNALKPVVVGQPSSVVEVGGNPAYLAVDVDGVNLSYQWKKDGVDIAGATNHTLSITDLNASQHEGNYTVVANNAFGSVTSSVAQVNVNGSITEGLVGWWKFDEMEGTVASDSSGHELNGTTNGTWVNGKIGGALSFNGSNQFVSLPAIPQIAGSNAKSLSVFHKPVLNAERSIISLGSASNNNRFCIFQDSNKYRFVGQFNDIYFDSIMNLSWQQVAVVYESNLLKLFVNGLFSEQDTISGLDTSALNHGRIAKASAPYDGEYFEGLIDDVRIYNRALSAFEVKALYELGEQPVQVSRSGTTTVVNGTVADGSITKSMLSQEVLNELNSSSSGGGVVPGSLLAVPANQSAPSGYELYQKGEPKDLVWEEKAPVSVARYAYDGVEVLGGKIYFVGGKDGSGAKNIAERYDPGTNTWETLANMSAARQGVACAVLNGKLYAIGGNGLSSVEVFDPSNGSWSAGVALPSEVTNGIAITVDGKIYLIGGNSSGQIINQVLCFDPFTSQWGTKANMPTARSGMKGVWFEDRIWVISGGISGGRTTAVESYDPTTDSWQAEASLITARAWPVAWVANGRIYVGGGFDGSSRLKSIEVYDSATKQWASAGNFPENKYVADAVVLNDKAYVVAGETASGVYSNKVFAADLNASVSGVFDLYRKDGNASSGVPVAQVADGSVTASMLSSEVSSALKPVVISQPNSVDSANGGSIYLSVGATGGDNTYQWKKDGVDIAGATSSTLSISDLNASQHEGNYTVVVSNAFGSVTSSVAQVDVNGSLTEGLVGWWKFDETDGDVAYDSSGNGNDGNLTNGPTWTEGKIGGALSFNGIDNYVLVPGTSDFDISHPSISAWVYSDNFNQLGFIFEKTSNGNVNSQYNLFLGYGNLNFRAKPLDSGYSGIVVSHSNLRLWSFISAIYDGQNRKIYVNGVLLSKSPWSETITTNPGGISLIGAYAQNSVGHSYFFNGLIDDLRIYERALSEVEAKALFELGEQPVQDSGSGTTTVVNGTVANGSITTNQLSEQILKYLKPEITQQPTASTIFPDTNHTFSVSAEGKYLTYQWKKNGENLSGETNATLTITDANATQHDGNYTVVVSNDFGGVESGVAELLIPTWLFNGLIAWYPLDQNASDMSGLGNHGTLKNTPQFVTQDGKSFVTFEATNDNDDTGDHILIPFSSFSPFTQITISGWLNFINSSHSGDHSAAIISFGDHTAGLIGVFAFNTGTNSGFGFAINRTILTLRGVQNTWVHFVITGDQETCAGYLNAENVGTGSGLGSYSGGNAAIGRDWWNNGLSTGTRLNGSLDEIRIYNRAMSATEVQALYQLGQ